MNKTGFVPASLALLGIVALAGCSSGGSHPTSQSSNVAPAATATPVAAATPEVSPGVIKRVQTTLQQQKLYNGRIDGVWGPQTQGAIHRYQQLHNLTQDRFRRQRTARAGGNGACDAAGNGQDRHAGCLGDRVAGDVATQGIGLRRLQHRQRCRCVTAESEQTFGTGSADRGRFHS
jgi:hypothetical protein